MRGAKIVKRSERTRTRAGAERTASLRDAVPESDPAYSIVSNILGLVPASRWTYARVESSGTLVSPFGSHNESGALSRLAVEFKRQRTNSPGGPRIAATLGWPAESGSGITLLFADARADYGILTLMRTVELGAFTSSEISVLTFALDAASERLSALRLRPLAHEPGANAADRSDDVGERPDEAFYVLDCELRIVLAWSSADQRRSALAQLETRIAERLPVVLEQTVRELTAAWSAGGVKAHGVARPVPFLVLRTLPLAGPAGLFIGVQIERFRPRNSLTGAASRFHISPREAQVLALLLDGKHLDQIATQLYITSSTVQDHIKSMLDKTGSANRSELIARVLGWDSTPSFPPAAAFAARPSSAS